MEEEEFKNIYLSEFEFVQDIFFVDNYNDVCDEAILSNKDGYILLYSKKKFQLWNYGKIAKFL
ncbi:hypothetical protein RhiirC2_791727 [Rhizophagus irregularis]|uniref:Uncharacterized protein n=1 Tax=Rhizophagus irregularis TaxID=588596 RepID=A0A2N1MIM4_9GLOM|nr:hypothetical protein RhiirC2_791727 [Rhizophagus irregularis]